MDRRYFLKSGGGMLASFGLMGMAPGFLRQFAGAAASRTETTGKSKILITIFQRGAVDGLNMVVPHGESEYYTARRNIAIQGPKKVNGAVDLDGYFGLHPSMISFDALWKTKKLAVIHSAGSPDNTRSHFDAQDYMESGTPGVKSTRDGWLNRVLQTNRTETDSLFRAVALSGQVPRTLMGRAPTIAMTDLSDFSIKAGTYTGSVQGGFEGIWQQQTNDELSATGQDTFEAVNYLKKANPAQYRPANGARYPASQLGRSLFQIAQLIKAGIGLEVAFAESGGWDTHTNQALGNDSSRGQLANLLRDFSTSITALTTDLGKKMDDVVILTMSEFGRTVRENGTRGTDHGHGNAMFVIGNSVKGGKVYGDWKGLKSSALFEGRDLAVTTDFRDVFGEIASRHLGVTNHSDIFPNYDAGKFKGFLG